MKIEDLPFTTHDDDQWIVPCKIANMITCGDSRCWLCLNALARCSKRLHCWYYTRYEGVLYRDVSDETNPNTEVVAVVQSGLEEPADQEEEENKLTICDLPFKEEMWRHIPHRILEFNGSPHHWCGRCMNAFATACKATHAWWN